MKIRSKMRRVFRYKYYRDLTDNQKKRLDALRERKAKLNQQMKNIKGPYRKVPAKVLAFTDSGWIKRQKTQH